MNVFYWQVLQFQKSRVLKHCVSLMISVERRQSNMAGMLDKQGFVYNNKISSGIICSHVLV